MFIPVIMLSVLNASIVACSESVKREKNNFVPCSSGELTTESNQVILPFIVMVLVPTFILPTLIPVYDCCKVSESPYKTIPTSKSVTLRLAGSVIVLAVESQLILVLAW